MTSRIEMLAQACDSTGAKRDELAVVYPEDARNSRSRDALADLATWLRAGNPATVALLADMPDTAFDDGVFRTRGEGRANRLLFQYGFHAPVGNHDGFVDELREAVWADEVEMIGDLLTEDDEPGGDEGR